jgi:hypothetical protein
MRPDDHGFRLNHTSVADETIIAPGYFSVLRDVYRKPNYIIYPNNRHKARQYPVAPFGHFTTLSFLASAAELHYRLGA